MHKPTSENRNISISGTEIQIDYPDLTRKQILLLLSLSAYAIIKHQPETFNKGAERTRNPKQKNWNQLEDSNTKTSELLLCWVIKKTYYYLIFFERYRYEFGLFWFSLVLWYIKHCWLFNAKSGLFIY